MTTPCKRKKRPLSAWEIQEASRVFGAQVDYSKVRIHECARWPDWLKKISVFIQTGKSTSEHNAVSLGNHVFFPVKLPEQPLDPADPDIYLFCWLIHELTHVWQYQAMGWRYLFIAFNIQIKLGGRAYDYGDEKGLQSSLENGLKLADFNLEQQGDIARAYYFRLVRNMDVSAWSPFADQFKDKA